MFFSRNPKNGRFVNVTDNRDSAPKLMTQRVTGRYGKLGTIHSNQAFFAVNRDAKTGRFVARGA